MDFAVFAARRAVAETILHWPPTVATARPLAAPGGGPHHPVPRRRRQRGGSCTRPDLICYHRNGRPGAEKKNKKIVL